MNTLTSFFEMILGLGLQAVCIFMAGLFLRRLSLTLSYSNRQLGQMSIGLVVFYFLFQLSTTAINPVAHFYEMKALISGTFPKESSAEGPLASSPDPNSAPISTPTPALKPGTVLPGQAAPPDMLKKNSL